MGTSSIRRGCWYPYIRAACICMIHPPSTNPGITFGSPFVCMSRLPHSLEIAELAYPRAAHFAPVPRVLDSAEGQLGRGLRHPVEEHGTCVKLAYEPGLLLR